MAIRDSIDNGDGSYTFTTDDGQQINSMGPMAAQQHQLLQGQAQLDPSIQEVATEKPEDNSTAFYPVPKPVQDQIAEQRPDVALPTPGAMSAAAAERAKPEVPAEPVRRGVTTAAPAHVDPGQLNFGGSGLPRARGAFVPGTKAGWVPSAREEQAGLQETPALKDTHDAAREQAEQAAASQASYETNLATSQAEEAGKRQAILERQQGEDAARHMKQQEQVGKAMGEYKQLADQFASNKVDPDQWMKQQGSGGRFGLGLAAALGAIGQGLAGIPEKTTAFVQGQIDNNIKAQTSNRDAIRSAMDAKANQMTMAQKAGMDEDEFAARQRALGWKAAEAELEKRRGDLGIQAADVNYQKTRAAIADKAAQAEEHYQQLVQTKVSMRSAFHPATSGGYVGPSPDDIDEKRVVKGPNGQDMYFTNDDGAKEYRAAAVDVHGFTGKIAKFEALRSNPKAHIPGTQESGEFEQLRGQITQEAPKTLSGLSRFTELEKDLAEKGRGALEGPGALKAMKEAAQEKIANLAYEHGGEPVQQMKYLKGDPRKGVVARGYKFTGGQGATRIPTMKPHGEGE